MKEKIIYADVCGSAQVSQKVVAMLENFFQHGLCANPNANHAAGLNLMEKIERARADIGHLLGCTSEEIIFNSGASEGCASVFHDFHEHNKMLSPVILYSGIEHPCTLENIRRYESLSTTCRKILHCDDGTIDLASLEKQLEEHQGKRVLLCVMAVHNETGVVQPIPELSAMAHRYGALLFSDLTQAVGKIPLNLSRLDIDYAIASGHKFGALPGIGMMYVKNRAGFLPLILGGGQEQKSRGGTQNYLGIFSLAVALEDKQVSVRENHTIHTSLRDTFESQISALIPDAHIIGKNSERIPLVSFIAFEKTNSRKLQLALNQNGIYTSTGSACSDKKNKLSPTVLALGLGEQLASNTLRISIDGTHPEEAYSIICSSIKANIHGLRLS